MNELKMQIKSIETQHVTEQPYAGLIEPQANWTPYYLTTIRYTDPRDGERSERVYSISGNGATEDESEKDAMDNLRHEQSLKAVDAYNKCQLSQGNYPRGPSSWRHLWRPPTVQV